MLQVKEMETTSIRMKMIEEHKERVTKVCVQSSDLDDDCKDQTEFIYILRPSVTYMACI